MHGLVGAAWCTALRGRRVRQPYVGEQIGQGNPQHMADGGDGQDTRVGFTRPNSSLDMRVRSAYALIASASCVIPRCSRKWRRFLPMACVMAFGICRT